MGEQSGSGAGRESAREPDQNLKIWNIYNVGIYHYPSARIRFNGLTILGSGDPESSACCDRGFHGEDYAATDIRILNSDIEGMNCCVLRSHARSLGPRHGRLFTGEGIRSPVTDSGADHRGDGDSRPPGAAGARNDDHAHRSSDRRNGSRVQVVGVHRNRLDAAPRLERCDNRPVDADRRESFWDGEVRAPSAGDAGPENGFDLPTQSSRRTDVSGGL